MPKFVKVQERDNATRYINVAHILEAVLEEVPDGQRLTIRVMGGAPALVKDGAAVEIARQLESLS